MPIDLNSLLKTPKTLHFIGVGGSGMYPIAQILLSAGHIIQGSDVNEGNIIDYERKLGMKIFMGHRSENVQGADLVVYSAAIGSDNPERAEAEMLGIPCIERSIMLGYVASLYNRPVGIAGTHGKTSSTGMCVQILESAGLNPAAVIGGRLPLINGYGKAGSGDGIVIEACEYHNTFLEITPHTAVLLNVDNDHLEFFGSMDNLKAAFAKFCNQSKNNVVYNADDANTVEVIESVKGKELYSFGFSENCYYKATKDYEYRPSYWAFTIVEKGGATQEIKLGAPGRHNIYNALAAYSASRLLGATAKQCAHGLESFIGTGRRFEILGTNKGVTIADDYAHHPTELKALLSTVNEMDYKNVWVVFQPYTYSRTEMLIEDFAHVLKAAPNLVLTQIMGGREKASDYSVRTIDLANKIPNCTWFENMEEAAGYVMANAKEGDLAITVGCGDIYKCAKIMLKL